MILSYRYRIEPNKAQSLALAKMLVDFCEIYNAALEHRITAYRHGSIINCFDQIKTLPKIRDDLPHQRQWGADAQAQVLRRLDKAYASFFRRVKSGEKAGFPRFRAPDRYHSADIRVGHGLMIRKTERLSLIGVPGEIKVFWHRTMPSYPKSAILSRNAGKWFIIFRVEVAPVERASPESIGIDLGLTSLVALSNGETIERANITKRHAAQLRRRQRALARCKRGSNGRRKARAAITKLQAHIGASRRDALHKVSASIVARFGRIAIEDMTITGMTRSILAKSVYDAAWGTLTDMLAYKASRAGCELVKVDPRGTSQTCPECGTVKAKTLKERLHRCPCGCRLDRDVAAAMVVHFRAFGIWPGLGHETPSQRVAA